MVTQKEACRLSGGVWDEATKTCKRGKQLQGTKQTTPATTPREQQTIESEREAIAKNEAIKKAEAQAAAEKAALDQPIGANVDLTQQPQSTTQGGGGRVVQNGVPGVIENGVFFADEQPQSPQQVIFNESGQAVGIVRPDGTALTGLSPADIDAQLQAGAVASDAQAGADISGQVGEFGQLGIEGTPFDSSALAGAVARGFIPAALRAGTGAVGGALLGAKVGAVGGLHGAAILGTLGFASGIASSILGEMKGQRTDNTNAQQRVLDEGKQVLQDWVTFAEANPSQKEFALSGFNQQLGLIDQAFRQMKLDTSRDVLTFESAIPNLAEFGSFYSASGERDVLSDEMRIAVLQVAPIDTRLLSLMARRTQ